MAQYSYEYTMADQIVVNISQAPVVLPLPSGKQVIVLPGFGVQGDHFLRYIQSGTFVPLSAVPVGFTVRGVSSPLGQEGTSSSGKSSVSFGNAPKSKQPAKAAPKTAAVALAAQGKDASNQNIAGVVEGVDAASLDIQTHMGLDYAQWIQRIQAISDTTFAQQMKLEDLRGLAVFMKIESAELLHTKADLIRAIRVKTNG